MESAAAVGVRGSSHSKSAVGGMSAGQPRAIAGKRQQQQQQHNQRPSAEVLLLLLLLPLPPSRWRHRCCHHHHLRAAAAAVGATAIAGWLAGLTGSTAVAPRKETERGSLAAAAATAARSILRL